MPFTTGLLSGLTLTTSTLYLTLLFHRQTRYQQSYTLALSTASLTDIYDPPPLRTPSNERFQRAGLSEMAKERWNSELSENVRRVAEFDWNAFGREAEGFVEGVVRELGRRLRSVQETAKEGGSVGEAVKEGER
ncbi:MAG: hypothetical protein Q9162_002571 [Coniocarpon cinnabarinum]